MPSNKEVLMKFFTHWAVIGLLTGYAGAGIAGALPRDPVTPEMKAEAAQRLDKQMAAPYNETLRRLHDEAVHSLVDQGFTKAEGRTISLRLDYADESQLGFRFESAETFTRACRSNASCTE